MDIFLGSITDVSKELTEDRLSPRELVASQLKRIESLNSRLNCFISVDKQGALYVATGLGKRKLNDRKPLYGIPVSLKDNISVKGLVTTCGSSLYLKNVAKRDSEVSRYLRNAGAVIIGKTNMTEFAWGFSKRHSYFGFPRNPWSYSRYAGGSSSGSAVAVASGSSFASIGTDTTGSVRIPASFCGVVGFKPTYGVVSNRGVFGSSKTLDHLGIIARTVEDVAIVFKAITAGELSKSDTKVRKRPDKIRGARTLVPADEILKPMHPEILDRFHDAVGVLAKLGADIKNDHKFKFIGITVPKRSRAIMLAEGSRIHSRNLAKHATHYPQEVRSAISEGVKLLSTEYESDLIERQKEEKELAALFTRIDFIVTPTVPIRSLKPGQRKVKLDSKLLPMPSVMTRFTSFCNSCRVPAISIPCGFDNHNVPVGFQIVAKRFAETNVLGLAKAYESETSWHNMKPPL